MPQTLKNLTTAFAVFKGLPADALDLDAPLCSYGVTSSDIRTLIRDSAHTDGVPFARGQKRDSVARGLADLAGFSDTAHAALKAYTPDLQNHSLRSLAEPLNTSAKVPAEGTPTGRVMRRFGGLFALAIAVPAVLATRPQAPVCTQCALTPSEQFLSYATFSVPAAAIVTIAAFAPALWHLYRTREARRDIGPLNV